MEPLDLRAVRPRSPRERLAGLAFTARVVDKLRAAQPGGDLNGFFPFSGFSEVWQRYTGVGLRELYDVVREAAAEGEVEHWIAGRTPAVDRETFNAKFEAFDTSRIPDAWRETFVATYPQELRDRCSYVFELLDADDDRLYGAIE